MPIVLSYLIGQNSNLSVWIPAFSTKKDVNTDEKIVCVTRIWLFSSSAQQGLLLEYGRKTCKTNRKIYY